MDEQELMDMKLHAEIDVNKYMSVFRVVGGWIYTLWHDDKAQVVFVPEPKKGE